MAAFNFYNPVSIHFGAGNFRKLPQLLGGRTFLLVTSQGWRSRGLDQMLHELDLRPRAIVDSILPNPSLDTTLMQLRNAPIDDCEAIVAIGGGSVLDAAKVFSVQAAGGEETLRKLITHSEVPLGYGLVPLIAVPTTAGTGSEVTPWGTIWDFNEHRKYSIALPDLWSESCICDPELTLSLPVDVTVQTGLDALSHAMEALWNVESNPISNDYAITAAQTILEALPKAVKEPSNIQWRSALQYGALLSGLAFSQTRTTIAHALSYPLTIYHQIPHGIACAFSLAAAVEAADKAWVESTLHPAFGENFSSRLKDFIKALGQATDFQGLGLSAAEVKRCGDEMMSYKQTENFRGDPEKFLKLLSQQH